MKQIVLATNNRNKFNEMVEALGRTGIHFSPAWSYPGAPEVAEDGESLEDNSLKKARALCEFTNLPALSDDTGLFVDALQGRPGIFAARYAGENCTYEDNVRKMLLELSGVPWEKRMALFRTIITIYYPDGHYDQVAGEVFGKITLVPKGEKGFGYDPIFLPAGQERVFAELTLEEKNRISHRGKALRAACSLLNS
jgi:XTP/dITP diphosphohydrolase